MSARCYWCDCDNWSPLYVDDSKLKVDKKTGEIDDSNAEIKEFQCTHCGHKSSEENPRIVLPLGVDKMRDWEGYEEWLMAKKTATKKARLDAQKNL